jgi:hypothetical protein
LCLDGKKPPGVERRHALQGLAAHDRAEKHKSINQLGMISRETTSGHRPPRVRDDRYFCRSTFSHYGADRTLELLYRLWYAAQRLSCRWRVGRHFWIALRATETGKVEPQTEKPALFKASAHEAPPNLKKIEFSAGNVAPWM